MIQPALKCAQTCASFNSSPVVNIWREGMTGACNNSEASTQLDWMASSEILQVQYTKIWWMLSKMLTTCRSSKCTSITSHGQGGQGAANPHGWWTGCPGAENHGARIQNMKKIWGCEPEFPEIGRFRFEISPTCGTTFWFESWHSGPFFIPLWKWAAPYPQLSSAFRTSQRAWTPRGWLPIWFHLKQTLAPRGADPYHFSAWYMVKRQSKRVEMWPESFRVWPAAAFGVWGWNAGHVASASRATDDRTTMTKMKKTWRKHKNTLSHPPSRAPFHGLLCNVAPWMAAVTIQPSISAQCLWLSMYIRSRCLQVTNQSAKCVSSCLIIPHTMQMPHWTQQD